MKQKHPEAWRNVLYDDDVMDLVLDFCLSPGSQWRRITSAQAIGRKRRAPVSTGGNFRIRDDEIDGLFGSGTDSSAPAE